jgi:hypothetical protein
VWPTGHPLRAINLFGWRGRSDRLLIEIIDTSTLVGLHGAT